MSVMRILLLLLAYLMCCPLSDAQRVYGLNVVGPFDKLLNGHTIAALEDMHADWVTFLPEAVIDRSTLTISPRDEKDWSHSIEGYKEFISECKQAGLKVILKPHIILEGSYSLGDRIAFGSTWRGDMQPTRAADWEEIEDAYADFILEWARIAFEEQVDAFFMGTELKSFVTARPDFWSQLATDLKCIYDGPLSYSANWDNYANIPFWDQLSFIGINGYFPVNQDGTPSIRHTKSSWKEIEQGLREIYRMHDKGILFTEFGYRNIEYAGKEPWLHVHQTRWAQRSDKSQYNLLKAFFETVWQEDYVLGGLLWNWSQNVNDKHNMDFTIQNKPAEALVREWFRKEENKT